MIIFELCLSLSFTYQYKIVQIDQPPLVLSRQMYVENSDGKYDEYIEAYKELAIDVAQLMAVENGGGGPNVDELEAMWANLFRIETKIAEVLYINNRTSKQNV